MDSNILRTYYNYLCNKEKNNDYTPSIDENTAIYNLTQDVIYSKLNEKLNSVDDIGSKKKIVNTYIQELEIKSEEDAISKIYGVNIKNIDNFKLNNSVEVFAFYDDKIGRKRLIENIDNKSLTKQLKETQEFNPEFQTVDYEKNSNEILKTKAWNNSNRQELKMVDINDYIEYPGNYGSLTEDTTKILEILVKFKDKIRYFNIDHKIALTKDNEVLELSKTEEGTFVINKPKKYESNIEEIENKEEDVEVLEDEKIEEQEEENEEIEIITEQEIKDELIIERVQTNEKISEIKYNIKKYYKDPSLMNDIKDESKKKFYEKLAGIYAERVAKQKKKAENVKRLTYKKMDLDTKGSISLIFLSILLLIILLIMII